MAVKNKAEPMTNAETANMPPTSFDAHAPRYSSAWLLYFIFTIGLIGLVGAYMISVPVYLVGRWLSKVNAPRGEIVTAQADRLLCSGIFILMKVQPWLNADIRFDLDAPDQARPWLIPGLWRYPVQARKPGQGRLLVSNHRSHLDAFILLSHVRGIRIFAKRTLFYIPFLGMMMRMSRQIPVAREINAFFDAMNEVRDRLRQGSTVHIFPEMTRCSPGHVGTRNFSALPFLIAIQEKVPVIPIVFRKTDEVWPKNCFGLAFRRPLQAWALDPIDPARFENAEELRAEVRRQINATLLSPLNSLDQYRDSLHRTPATPADESLASAEATR